MGGLVGKNIGNIDESYYNGYLNGSSNVGGLVGENTGSGTISNSFTVSDVDGSTNINPIVGLDSSGTYDNTYFQNVSFNPNSGEVGESINNQIWYFYNHSNSPLSLWDSSIWTFHTDRFPDFGDNIQNYYIQEILYSGDGSGTYLDPYKITNCQKLNESRVQLDKYYILMNNIDCLDTSGWNGGDGFKPIGNLNQPFTGSLNGNGFMIYNLFINRDSENNFGLYGVTLNSNIYNLTLSAEITGNDNVGRVVGNNFGNISNVVTSGTVTGGSFVGGIVGNNSGNILNVLTHGTVDGGSFVGGVVGVNSNLIIINSSSNSTITGESFVGGIVGDNSVFGKVLQSYYYGEIFGNEVVGGIVGNNYGNISDLYLRKNSYNYEREVPLDHRKK